MNNLFEEIKFKIRKLLLSTAKNLKGGYTKIPTVRETKNIFTRNIKIPVFVSMCFTIAAAYCMLVLSIGIDYRTMVFSLIFVAMSAVFFIVNSRGEKNILKDSDAVVLLCFLFIVAILVLQISKTYFSPFISPISAFSLMAAMLLSARIGLLYAVLASLFSAVLNDMEFEFFFVSFFASFIVMVNCKSIRKRSDFILSGIKTAAVNTITILMFYLFNTYNILDLTDNVFYGILNGVFVTVILLVFMPLIEKTFSRTTNIKLIELSDFNNPLLKKLMINAPATYHHSIMTATIAEQAAEAIGENSLLARVSAYYHDVGKLKNPEYFIENQMPGHNLHDGLTPTMSSLILISHVKDGAALAKQYHIDSDIINIIEQHHGTSSIYSFYHKSLETTPDTNIENFKYPGPKPTTKIAAIVMLSDSSEAACRTIEEPTPVRITEMVEKITNNKFIDGQFSDCPITLKDLEIMKDSIVATLIGIYHARIEYKEIAK
jgi:putative nucleotidyltransferase with HDIG domain